MILVKHQRTCQLTPENCVVTNCSNENTDLQEKRKEIKEIRDGSYLSIEVIQKILGKLLNEAKMPKEKLIDVLGITLTDLDDLLCMNRRHLIYKINLPLIKLFCETNFSTFDN